MTRQINLRAALIGIATAVMTVVVLGVLLYTLLENHKKAMADECVHDVTEGLPGMDLSEDEITSLFIQCLEDPEVASDAMFAKYLDRVVDAAK